MDGEIVGFSPDISLGRITGEDNRRYDFAAAEWRSAGQPQPGDSVRFVVEGDRATQIYLLRPSHLPPVTAVEAIGAVYSIAFSRTGDEDPFGRAAVRSRSLLLPALIAVAFGTIQLLLAGELPVSFGGMSFLAGAVVFVALLIAAAVFLAVAAGIVWLLGRVMGQRGRSGAGILAYLWAQAVLLQPAVCVLRIILGPHDPTFILILLGVGLVAAVIGAGRVLKSGFQLGNAGAGVFIVLAGSVGSYLIDRLLGAL